MASMRVTPDPKDDPDYNKVDITLEDSGLDRTSEESRSSSACSEAVQAAQDQLARTSISPPRCICEPPDPDGCYESAPGHEACHVRPSGSPRECQAPDVEGPCGPSTPGHAACHVRPADFVPVCKAPEVEGDCDPLNPGHAACHVRPADLPVDTCTVPDEGPCDPKDPRHAVCYWRPSDDSRSPRKTSKGRTQKVGRKPPSDPWPPVSGTGHVEVPKLPAGADGRSFLRAAKPFDYMECPTEPHDMRDPVARAHYKKELALYNEQETRRLKEAIAEEEAKQKAVEAAEREEEIQKELDATERDRLQREQKAQESSWWSQPGAAAQAKATLANHLVANAGLQHPPGTQEQVHKTQGALPPTEAQQALLDMGTPMKTPQDPPPKGQASSSGSRKPLRPVALPLSAQARTMRALKDRSRVQHEENLRKRDLERGAALPLHLPRAPKGTPPSGVSYLGLDSNRYPDWLPWDTGREMERYPVHPRKTAAMWATESLRREHAAEREFEVAGLKRPSMFDLWSPLSPMHTHEPFAYRELGRQQGDGITNISQVFGWAYLGMVPVPTGPRGTAAQHLRDPLATPADHVRAVTDAFEHSPLPKEQVEYLKSAFSAGGVGLQRLGCFMYGHLTSGHALSPALRNKLERLYPEDPAKHVPIVYDLCQEERDYLGPWDVVLRTNMNQETSEDGAYAAPANDWWGLLLTHVGARVAEHVRVNVIRLKMDARRKREASARGRGGPLHKGGRLQETNQGTPAPRPSGSGTGTGPAPSAPRGRR